MNEKDIAELRRRCTPEKTNIQRVCGCYVNEKKEIISEFSQSLGIIPQADSEEIISILKKVLSGSHRKNLVEIDFSTKQVNEGEEYALLAKLRNSELSDEEAVHSFFKNIAASYESETSYLIMLAYDVYDVPHYSKSGDKEDFGETFRYILCAVCPITMTKPALGYKPNENKFRSIDTDWVVSRPNLGFVFPGFDRRKTNIYEALYYTKNVKDERPDFTDVVFASRLPMPAAKQKDAFDEIVAKSITDDCDYELIQSVHGEITEMIAEHKASRDPDPLVIDRPTAASILRRNGAPDEKVAEFEKKFDEEFGSGAELSPKNLISVNRFEVKTQDVKVKIDPAHRDLVETRIIDGIKYIMIRVDGAAEVNGIDISIK